MAAVDFFVTFLEQVESYSWKYMFYHNLRNKAD